MKIDPDRVRKTAQILRVVMKLFFWLTLFAGLGTIFLCLLLLTGVVKLPATGGLGLSSVFNGLIYYKVDLSMYDRLILKPVIIAFITTITLGVALAALIFRQVGKILRTVEEGCPFTEENGKRLSLMAVALIIGSVLLNVAEYRFAQAMVDCFQLNNLEVRYAINVNMLTAGLLLLILAGVFKYGNFLQKEYDSTL